MSSVGILLANYCALIVIKFIEPVTIWNIKVKFNWIWSRRQLDDDKYESVNRYHDNNKN